MAPRRVSIGSGGAAIDEGIFDEGSSADRIRRSSDDSRSSGRGEDRSSFLQTPSGRPWLRRVLLGGLLLALATLPLATVAIAVLVDDDELVGWLEPRLSSALNREVALGDVGVALLPRPALRVSDIRVGGVEDAQPPSVLAARDVHLEAALLPLFTGKVRVDRLRLEGLDLHLAVTEDGVSNFGDLIPEGEAQQMASGGPVAFAVTDVEVEDASFTWFDGTRNQSFGLSGVSGSMDLHLEPGGGWTAGVTGSSDSLLIRLPDVTEEIVRTEGPSLTLDLRGDDTLGEIVLEGGSLEHRGETVAVDGTVAGLSDLDPGLDLRFSNPELGLGGLAAFVPRSTRERLQPAFRGTANLSLSLRGRLRDPDSPALRGMFTLSGAGLLLGGEPRLEDVEGRIRLRDEAVELDSIRGSFASGPFELSATYARADGTISGTLEAAPDVDDFRRVGLTPEDVELSGAAVIALDVEGPLAAPDSLDASGSVRLTGIQLEHPDLEVPLYVPSAELSVRDSDVGWSDLTLLVGTDALTVAGRLEGALAAWWREDQPPRLEATVVGARLDLDALLPPTSSGERPTYARRAFSHLAAAERGGGPEVEAGEEDSLRRPRDLPVHGVVEVAVDALLYRDHDLRDVEGTLTLSDSTLAVREAGFTAWEGTGRLSLDMVVGPESEAPFALHFETRDADAETFLSTFTPMDRAVSGRLDLAVDVSGSLDRALMPVSESLDGEIEMTVTEGSIDGTGINFALADFLAEERWRAIPFSSWRTEISLQDGLLVVSESRLESDMASARLQGAVGFGGAVDLAMALSIPPDRLEAVSLRRTGVAQTVLDRLREAESPLELGIRLGGTLAGPTLEPDALAGAAGDDGVSR
ncbi:MAG: AsmA-like C-terminal region-containing protein [Longimicrobiales bacterium]|nr:AsmA-like C-terminal region-containing protein [Longimicrobiales bacterium]